MLSNTYTNPHTTTGSDDVANYARSEETRQRAYPLQSFKESGGGGRGRPLLLSDVSRTVPRYHHRGEEYAQKHWNASRLYLETKLGWFPRSRASERPGWVIIAHALGTHTGDQWVLTPQTGQSHSFPRSRRPGCKTYLLDAGNPPPTSTS